MQCPVETRLKYSHRYCPKEEIVLAILTGNYSEKSPQRYPFGKYSGCGR
jgi:hypothetical protein